MLRLRTRRYSRTRHAGDARKPRGCVLLRNSNERKLHPQTNAGGRGRGDPPRDVSGKSQYTVTGTCNQTPIIAAGPIAGSGTVLREALAAAELLEHDWNVST